MNGVTIRTSLELLINSFNIVKCEFSLSLLCIIFISALLNISHQANFVAKLLFKFSSLLSISTKSIRIGSVI